MFGRRKGILKVDCKIGRGKNQDAWIWIEIAIRKRKIIGGWTQWVYW